MSNYTEITQHINLKFTIFIYPQDLWVFPVEWSENRSKSSRKWCHSKRRSFTHTKTNGNDTEKMTIILYPVHRERYKEDHDTIPNMTRGLSSITGLSCALTETCSVCAEGSGIAACLCQLAWSIVSASLFQDHDDICLAPILWGHFSQQLPPLAWPQRTGSTSHVFGAHSGVGQTGHLHGC